ncbi:MAG: Holliday junction branch migration protein RuvA [Negativicoccus succinicivorans]|nr:Holliday junction branch migration protein RuvA [Negativicoccus succinicivorans]
MIGYLHGKITRLELDWCLLDVGGIGYRLRLPASTREAVGLGEMVTLYTYLQVREDALSLYGFASEAEYDLFTLLITVSGIGPKVAIGIISAIAPEAFFEAIRIRNKAVLMKLPGIGKKSAERLVLELKDKVPAASGAPVDWPEDVATAQSATGPVAETVQALVGLGYTEQEVRGAAEKLAAQYPQTDRLLRAVLAQLGKERG